MEMIDYNLGWDSTSSLDPELTLGLSVINVRNEIKSESYEKKQENVNDFLGKNLGKYDTSNGIISKTSRLFSKNKFMKSVRNGLFASMLWATTAFASPNSLNGNTNQKSKKTIENVITPGGFMDSIPYTGPAPSTAVPQMTVNGPTPWPVLMNPYSQPNIQVQLGRGPLDWYGSGDVNDDGKVDSTDVKIIESGNVPPQDLDRADVNGDGVVNQADADLIQEYINHTIPYLPGYWDSLTTRTERVSWLEKMMKIEKALPSNVNLAKWACQNFVARYEDDFYGVSNQNAFLTWYKENAGVDLTGNVTPARFNIPVFTVNDYDSLGTPHAVAGVFVGNSDTTFSDLYCFYWDNNSELYHVTPGSFDMNPDSSVSISKFAYSKGLDNKTRFDDIWNFVIFKLNNGNGTMESYYEIPGNPDYSLVIDNPNIIQVHESGLPDSVDVDGSKVPSKAEMSLSGLENLGFNVVPSISADSTKLPPNLSYVTGDTTWSADSTSMTVPYRFYTWITSGGVTKVDSSASTNVKYGNILSSAVKVDIKNKNGSSLDTLVVDAGRVPSGQALTPQYLFQNGYPDAFPDTSKVNTTAPLGLYYTDHDTVWADTTLSPDKTHKTTAYAFTRTFTDFVTTYGDTLKASADELIEVENVTAVNEQDPLLPKKFQVYQNYPNPFNPTTTIMYDLARPGEVEIDVYNILGQKVKAIEGGYKVPGEYRFEVDMTGFPSGVYLYRLEEKEKDSKVESELGKMVLVK